MSDGLLARVQILLDANTVRFEQGMAKAKTVQQQTTKEMKDGFSTVTSEIKKTQSQVDSYSQTLSRHQDDVSAVQKSYSVLTTSIKSAIAGISLSQIIGKSDEYTSVQNKLKLVTEGQQQLAAASSATFTIAQKTGAEWSNVSDVYSKFASNGKTLNINQAEQARLAETVAKAVAISGSSHEAASGALIQFGQALDGNILHAEEYNSLTEGGVGLLNAMAKGLGVTRGELRQMMLQGQLTGDVIVKSLLKASGSVDDLYAKTDKTAAQGFTKISNAGTLKVGEFVEATESSKTLNESLTYLAENLDKVTNVAIVAGTYWAGTYIPLLLKSAQSSALKSQQLIEQTALQYAAINAEKTAAAQDLVRAQTQVVNTQSTLTALAAERALEVQRLKAQITAQGLAASQTRLAEISVIEAQVKRELAVANEALAVSQTRVAAAQSVGMTVGKGLLSLVGGPVGLGLTVAGVAATYLMFRDNTAKATEKLAEQTSVANKTKDELLALQGVQKKGAINDLKESFTAQNDELKKLGYTFNSHIIAIQNMYRGNEEIVDISNQVRLGTLSQEDAIKRLNKLDFIDPNQLKQLEKDNKLYREKAPVVQKVADALSVYGINVKLAGNEASNASVKVKSNTAILIDNAKAATDAAKAHKDFFDSLNKDVRTANETYVLLGFGYSKDVIEKIQKLQEAKQKVAAPGTTAIVTQAEIEDIVKAQKSLDDVKDREDAITEAKKKQTEEMKKQQKIREKQKQFAVNDKVRADAQRYGYANLEQKNSLPAGLLAAVNMQESSGNQNAIGPKTRWGTAKGGFQMIDATGSRYGLNRKTVFDLGKSADAAARYLKDLIKQFNGDIDKAIMAYNAGPENVKSGKAYSFKETRDYLYKVKGRMAVYNGYDLKGMSDDGDPSKAGEDELKAFSDQLKKRQELREFYYTSWEKLEQEHNEKVQDIQNAYAHDPMTRDMLLQLEATRNAKAIEEWVRYEDQRVREEVQANQEIIQARQDAFALINNATGQLEQVRINALANTTLSPRQQASFSLSAQHQDGYSQLGDTLTSGQQAINSNQFLTEQQKYDQLESIYKQYLDSKKALGEQYAKEETDLARNQHVEQLNLWASLTSQAQNTWSQLTQSIKDANGEQSAAYKAAFLAQQVFSIASTLIAAHVAATQAAADPSNITMIGKVTASEAMLAMGYANAAMIGAQTIAGIFHGGNDYVPREATYLLDEGERVLSPRQNTDLTKFLANQDQSSFGNGTKINIFHDPSLAVDTEENNGMTEMQVRKIAREAVNQGWGELRNPNSRASKSVQQNTNAGRRR